MRAFLIPLLIIASIGTAQAYFSERALNAQAPDVELPLSRTDKWNPKIFEWLSLGQTQAVVDYMLIRFMVEDPAIQHVAPGTHPPAYFHLDLATQLDPAFFSLYPAGANYLAVIRNDSDGAIELLLRARQYAQEILPSMPPKMTDVVWRMRWQIPMLLGYNYLYEKRDLPSGAKYFLEAGKEPDAPPYLIRLERQITAPGGLYEIGMRITAQQMQSAFDKDPESPLGQELKKRLNALKLQYYLWSLNLQWAKTKPAQKRDFNAWLMTQGVSGVDFYGGKLMVENGKITTTTVFERALGLE